MHCIANTSFTGYVHCKLVLLTFIGNMTSFCFQYRDVLAKQKKEAEHHAAKLQDEYTLLMAAAREEGPAGHLLDLQSKLAAHQTQCIAVRLNSPCLIVNAYSKPAVNSTCCCSRAQLLACCWHSTLQQTAACFISSGTVADCQAGSCHCTLLVVSICSCLLVATQSLQRLRLHTTHCRQSEPKACHMCGGKPDA